MKLTSSIKDLFNKNNGTADQMDMPTFATFEHPHTDGVANKIRATPSSTGDIRPLPFIGHRSAGAQKVIAGSIIGFGAITLLIAGVLYTRESNHQASYSTRATEMQMLSQQMARAAAQAVLAGNIKAFATLQDSYNAFDQNMTKLLDGDEKTPPVKGAALTKVASLRKNWDKSFAAHTAEDGTTTQAVVKDITSNQAILVDLGKNVAAVNANDADLLKECEALVSALETANATPVQLNAARKLLLLSQKLAKTSNAIVAVETIDPEVLTGIGTNVTDFRTALTGLQEGDAGEGITAVADPAIQEQLKSISQRFIIFEEVGKLFTESVNQLIATRAANATINEESDKLLVQTQELAQIFVKQSNPIGFWAAGLVGLAILALGLYTLVTADKQEAARRRLESEKENKRNQEAILRLLNEMSDLADGDLTVHASVTEDLTGAIADSMNYTIEELRNLIININGATEQVTSATDKAQGITVELLDAAQRQSKDIIDTNESVQQMARSIQDVSGSAAESAIVANQSLQAATKGAKAVQNSISGMNEIREQIQETAKRIKRLGESSQEIGEIVELISDITEQTNVLALNAAIQAASAGDAGRGFTVVAEEVQRLAERSAAATKQIGAIVKTIQTDTHDAVAAMELSTHGVVEGAKLSDAAGQSLSEIEKVSGNLASLIQRISESTQEQAKMADQVSRSMQDILQITEQTTDGTKQTAVSIGQLTGLAAELKGSVSGFKLS